MMIKYGNTVLAILLLILLSFSSQVCAGYKAGETWEVKGKPRVIHYSKDDYASDSQFWVMTEDDDGVLYFGNNDGIAIYNGEAWNLVPLPNGSTVRGLYYASDGFIYVGGYNEIGRLHQDQYGKYQYESLNHLLRVEDQNFDNIWQITALDGYIIFRSFKMLIVINDSKTITLPAEDRFQHINVINNQLYVVDTGAIKQLSLGTMEFTLLTNGTQYEYQNIVSLLPGRNPKELIAYTTIGNSYTIDLLTNKANYQASFIEEGSSDQIFCAIKTKEGNYFLGMINSMTKSIRYVDNRSPEVISYGNLQDQTVLNLYQSKDGNIWALLNTGIDCIETSSPISKIFDHAAIYDATKYQDKLYLATNQGVYSAPMMDGSVTLEHTDFSLKNGLEAQAWSLSQAKNNLIISHDKGLFIANEKSMYQVEGTSGVWKVIPIAGVEDSYFACTYDGLYVIEYTKEKRFVLKNKVGGFDISGRDILPGMEPLTYWVCHGYQGVYKIKLQENLQRIVSLEKYTDQNGLPSPYNNNVFIWGTDTVFTAADGVYSFDKNQNLFIPHEELTRILGKDKLIRKVLKTNDRTWFIKDDQLGFFSSDESNPTPQMDLFLSLKGTFMKSMEYLLPIGKDQILVGTNNGLYAYDLKEGNKNPAKVRLSKIRYKNGQDSLIYCSLPKPNQERLKLPNNTSGLFIAFETPKFSAQKDVQYRYKLENVDKHWSTWSTYSEREYSYLKSGRYTFNVQSRTSYGELADGTQFEFEILPLWYETTLAKILFTFIAIVIIIFVRVAVKRKLRHTKQEANKMKASLELEIANIKLEKEKSLIEKDKKMLEEDVIHKSKELANYTILLLKKRELLSQMAEELKELRTKVKISTNKEIIRSLTRKININLQDEEHLNVFDANFERVHQDFFNELKHSYPNLTQKEMRLCGFVKMNFTNKEIATILNISVRGVETARYRLRKNLSLEKEINMVEFLETLSSSASEERSLDSEEEEYFKDQT